MIIFQDDHLITENFPVILTRYWGVFWMKGMPCCRDEENITCMSSEALCMKWAVLWRHFVPKIVKRRKSLFLNPRFKQNKVSFQPSGWYRFLKMEFDYNQPYILACLFAAPRCHFCWSCASSDYSPVLSMGFRIPVSFVPKCHFHLSCMSTGEECCLVCWNCPTVLCVL